MSPRSDGVLRWRPTKAPTASSRTDDIWFVDPNVGWAVNSNGQILHSRDGFETWVEQFHDANVYLRCVAFASPMRGWVGSLTAHKTFYETSDGGLHWTPVENLPPNAPPAVCGLWVVNEAVAYAAGSNRPEQPVGMMKTVDGGQSWIAWDMRPWADNLIDVFFVTEQCGWIVGGRTDDPRDPVPAKPRLRPVVLYTEDGGRTWVDRVADQRPNFPLGEWGWKIQFLDEQFGFISLQNYDAGAILTTRDGGKTWMRQPINDPQMNGNLEGIGFVDDQHGWVGGWGDRPKMKLTSSETLDGGCTWRDANEIGKTINRFRFFGRPVTVGYAAGETVYKYSSDPITDHTSNVGPAKRIGRLLDDLEPLVSVGSVSFPVAVPSNASRLLVSLWDTDGPLVRTLLDESRPKPGQHLACWDGTDGSGKRLTGRSVLIRVTVDDTSESKLLLVH